MIFRLFYDGLCNSQIARALGTSEHLVRGRLTKLSRQALLFHARQSARLKIFEPIAFDGVEHFARSKYEPNNLNQAIGSDSLFVYDFSFAPLNRKGRMSPRQKARKAWLDKREGTFKKDCIRHSTGVILKRLLERVPGDERLYLRSDRHFQYRRAIQHDLSETSRKRISHATISSRVHRGYRHILFPVNHYDNLLRHHVKAYMRKTIAFSKTHGVLIQKYALFMTWRNYMRSQFVKPHRHNPATNYRTPAMYVGLCVRPLSYGEVFGLRLSPDQVTLNPEWSLFFKAQHAYPRVLKPKT